MFHFPAAYGEKKIFVPDDNSQRFGLLLPQRRNERRIYKCVAYGEKKIRSRMTECVIANLIYIYIRPDFLRENLSSMSASWKAREPEPAAKRRAGYKSLKKKVQCIAPEQVAAARDFGREAGIDAGRVPAPGAPGALVLQAAEEAAANLLQPMLKHNNGSQAAEEAAEEAAAKWLDTMLKKKNKSQSNHLLNPQEFPRKSRGGGAKGFVSPHKKILEVSTIDGIAHYKPNTRYEMLADNLRELVKRFEIKTTQGEYVHPLLLFSGAKLTQIQGHSIAKELLNNTKKTVVGFSKLLCTFGIGSKTDKKSKNVTWTFDPERWNRTGYRITKGGDCKGGKPQVKLVPSDARLTTPAAPAAAPVLPAPHSRIPGSAFSSYVRLTTPAAPAAAPVLPAPHSRITCSAFSSYVSKALSHVRVLKAVAGPQALPPE